MFSVKRFVFSGSKGTQCFPNDQIIGGITAVISSRLNCVAFPSQLCRVSASAVSRFRLGRVAMGMVFVEICEICG